ncbi:hypothetical protein IV488_10870 [Enterococcus faecalis]|uniref:hypothetical protein n=1 Tax=Enterococcus faecalis TaxID=1351 RepID=UPI000352CF41|nr:hypothetical protein [Enterococcus faecalis]EGO6639881.1 hypothetical protein [Enterococcus faecalis]EGO8005234.1 hypothetical protein [Enterococcus faecalis]EGO8300625.1 hypothetical protein [Enterococcus faecalis]EGO8756698.1 hypothetical protein [Enterococcus faecalis]EGO8832896.1 hypothetical protein [Enterococcus faecalis]
MDFYIQMGHGMQGMCQELIKNWGDGTVIVSPVNIDPNKLESFCEKINNINGDVLFDPQMYFPEKYHKNLKKYDYWQYGMNNAKKLVEEIVSLNSNIRSKAIILPSYTTNKIDSTWLQVQEKIVDESLKHVNDYKLLLTVSLDKDVMKDAGELEKIISLLEKLPVKGVYLVCEHPDKLYLVDKPLWLLNLMNLVTAIKRLNKQVVVGYASHQMLCLSSAKCDAIASGNFLNVRWFQRERFETLDKNNPSKRSTWYYAPAVLSEFKLAFLDIAYQQDLLGIISPPPSMQSEFSNMLFKGELPSSSDYSEKHSHRHYLNCLYYQCKESERATYLETYNGQLLQLQTAETLLRALDENGIKGQKRDFTEIVDVTRSALINHNKTYNIILNNIWDKL